MVNGLPGKRSEILLFWNQNRNHSSTRLRKILKPQTPCCQNIFFVLSLSTEDVSAVKQQAAGKPNAVCITAGEGGNKKSKKEKNPARNAVSFPPPITGEVQGDWPVRRTRTCSATPRSEKQKHSPLQTPLLPKRQSQIKSHGLRLALSFPLRKPHLLPLQI